MPAQTIDQDQVNSLIESILANAEALDAGTASDPLAVQQNLVDDVHALDANLRRGAPLPARWTANR